MCKPLCRTLTIFQEPMIPPQDFQHSQSYNEQQFVDRRASGNGLSVKLDLLHSDVQDMKTVLKELTAAISRLAVVESDMSHFSTAQERAFKVLERLEQRVTALEKHDVSNNQTNTWVTNAMWAAVAVAATFVARKVGLL